MRHAEQKLGRSLSNKPEPELPADLAHLFAWFLELHAGRQGGGFGPNPLSYEGIEAWSRLSGNTIRPIELMAIKELDAAWIEVAMEDADGKGGGKGKSATVGKGKRK